ncbi:MAG TPA: hypothetical protein VF773_10925 [Verrucomicrobiae bacterium]
MKNLICLLFIALAVSLQAADSLFTVTINFTGIPANGDSVTANGKVWTFRTTVTSPSTEVLIGASAQATADNYFAKIQSDPYPSISSAQQLTVVRLAGAANFTITASKVGAWGTVTVTSTTLNRHPVTYPFSAREDKLAMANAIIEGLRDYAVVVFPANTPALANFVSLSGAQTITGAKILQGDNSFSGANFFSGLTTLSNIHQRIQGGDITNAFLRHVKLSGPTNNILVGSAFLIGEDDNGKLGLWETPDGYTRGGAASYSLEDHVVVNGAIGNFYWGKKSASNNWTAMQNFSVGFMGIGTNLIAALQKAWVSNLYFMPGGTGMEMSNAAPRIQFRETDYAVTDNVLWDFIVNDGEFSLRALSDDGLSSSKIFRVIRDGFASAAFEVIGSFSASGGLTANEATIITGITAESLDAEVVGITGSLQLANAASPGADPTTRVDVFSLSGLPVYRMPGGGRDLHLHNQTAEYIGAGSDHAYASTAYAQLVFGSGGNVISLPTAGTYRIWADLAVESGTAANETYAAKFYNVTAGADVTSSERQINSLAATKRGQLFLDKVITVTVPTTIHVYVRNANSSGVNAGAIDSVETKLGFTRLY